MAILALTVAVSLCRGGLAQETVGLPLDGWTPAFQRDTPFMRQVEFLQAGGDRDAPSDLFSVITYVGERSGAARHGDTFRSFWATNCPAPEIRDVPPDMLLARCPRASVSGRPETELQRVLVGPGGTHVIRRIWRGGRMPGESDLAQALAVLTAATLRCGDQPASGPCVATAAPTRTEVAIRAPVPPDQPVARAPDDGRLGCPLPGTRIETTSDVVLQFTDGDGVYCNYVNQGNEPLARWSIFWDARSPAIAEAGRTFAKLWPLYVGRSVSAMVSQSGGGKQNRYEYRVARQERITVPAGEFDTYVIEFEQGGGNQAHHSIQRYWYAPEVGYFVRYGVEIKSGFFTSGNPQPWEAMKVKLVRD